MCGMRMHMTGVDTELVQDTARCYGLVSVRACSVSHRVDVAVPCVDAVHRNQVSKKTLVDNLDLLLLTIDEIIDDGYVQGWHVM